MAADPNAVERLRSLVNLVPLRLRLERWEGRRDVCQYLIGLAVGACVARLITGSPTEVDAGVFGVWFSIAVSAVIGYIGCTWKTFRLRGRLERDGNQG